MESVIVTRSGQHPYGIDPKSPATLGATALVLLAVSLVAGALSTRRVFGAGALRELLSER